MVEILLTNSKPIYVDVCYRTDGNNLLVKCLENTLSMLRQDCDVMVLGDFNICLHSNKSKLSKDYKSLLSFFHCKQLINSPTRVTDKTSTLLDHIFTNNTGKICQSGVLPVGLSDHFITYCTRKSSRGYIGKHNTIKIRSLKNYSVIDFLNKLRNIDWTVVTNCTEVNTAWPKFKDIFINVLDEIAPIKQIRIKTRTEPWMNGEILNLINERDKALTIANKNKRNKALRNHFNFLRNKVQREVRKAKSNYLKDRLEENKNNPKKIWKQFKMLVYSNKRK